jgi:hypothetical protein
MNIICCRVNCEIRRSRNGSSASVSYILVCVMTFLNFLASYITLKNLEDASDIFRSVKTIRTCGFGQNYCKGSSQVDMRDIYRVRQKILTILKLK